MLLSALDQVTCFISNRVNKVFANNSITSFVWFIHFWNAFAHWHSMIWTKKCFIKMAVFEIELYFVTLKGGCNEIICTKYTMFEIWDGIATFFAHSSHTISNAGAELFKWAPTPRRCDTCTRVSLVTHLWNFKTEKRPILKMKFYKSKSTKWARLSK